MTSSNVCDFTNSSASCYTASWYLIWDQIRYWGLFQLPILALSVVYDWLQLGNDVRMERLRKVFDAPLIKVANFIVQIITCVYVGLAWIVRGGSLTVSFSNWSIESLFLITTAVGYGTRWIAAPDKVYYTLQLHSLFDLLSLISHFCISFQYDMETGQRSWLDFGFLRSYILYIVVDHLFTRFPHKTFILQVLLVFFKACVLVFFAACVLFSLERLGDLPGTDSFLLHVYKCSNPADTNHVTSSILVNNASGTGLYTQCTETWSFFSSIYFMYVTVSTVGYGDFSPKTVLGQVIICCIIVYGIYTFANEISALFSLYGDEYSSSHVKYHGSRQTAHVVVTGNPSAAQMKDFIREFFHPDHEPTDEQDECEPQEEEDSSLDGLERGKQPMDPTVKPERNGWHRHGRIREKHIVILVRHGEALLSSGEVLGKTTMEGQTSGQSFQQEVMAFVNAHPQYQKRVFLIYGSPLSTKDLELAKVGQASAIFFLPNKIANDGNREDAATVLRVLSVVQYQQTQRKSHEHPPLYVMVVNAENRLLVEATGVPTNQIVCADELRLGLMGLSCRCPGLSTLVSNLITSRSGFPDESEIQASNAPPLVLIQPWFQEYVRGAANELYKCHLNRSFIGKTFLECVQQIHLQSQGLVTLVAIQRRGETVFNPGHTVRITPTMSVFLIAESMAALTPFSSHEENKNETQSIDSGLMKVYSQLRFAGRRAQHNVERRIPQHVRNHVIQYRSRLPSELGSGRGLDDVVPLPPPSTLLTRGGHIVVCSNVAHDGGGARGIARLINFLKPLRSPHIERNVPVVLVDASSFDSISWLPLYKLGQVYHVHGSPQRHAVLIQAGVSTASSVVVLAQGTATGYDDSKAIFNAILIHTALRRSRRDIFTIIELRDVQNNQFLDPVPSFHASKPTVEMDEQWTLSPASQPHNRRMTGRSNFPVSTLGSIRGSMTETRESITHLSWWNRQHQLLTRGLYYTRAFFFGRFQSSTSFRHFKKHDEDEDPTVAATSHWMASLVNGEDDMFFEERFMRGALFPSYVADDLLIQSFFNPSMTPLIRSILDGTSCFMLYDVPKKWRGRSSVTYGELFLSMTSGIASALPIGLLRARGEGSHSYVYTTPISSTIVHPEDKVFVIIDVTTLHRVANKLQRCYRRLQAIRRLQKH